MTTGKRRQAANCVQSFELGLLITPLVLKKMTAASQSTIEPGLVIARLGHRRTLIQSVEMLPWRRWLTCFIFTPHMDPLTSMTNTMFLGRGVRLEGAKNCTKWPSETWRRRSQSVNSKKNISLFIYCIHTNRTVKWFGCLIECTPPLPSYLPYCPVSFKWEGLSVGAYLLL